MTLRLICLAVFLHLASACYSDGPDSLLYASAQPEVPPEEPSPLESVLPQSPQAAALARYGEYPVGHTTGVPDISIPIYEIKLGDYTLPVNISYHASGIKVADVASTVGLGWSLNAGGVITRSICGAPDMDGCNEKYCDYDSLRELISQSQTENCNTTILNELINGRDNSSGKRYYDCESDRYVFNFADKSGVFRYSYKDKRFIPVDYSKMCIEGNGTGSTSWFRIVDTDGTEYIFRQLEYTGVKSDENTTDITSWYLTCVNTKYGKIELNYTMAEDYTAGGHLETMTTGCFSHYIPPSPGTDALCEFYTGSRYNAWTTEYLFKTPVLSSIVWNGNTIKFHYQNDRQDVWKTRLVRIEVLNSDGEVRKTAEFDNFHFWGNTGRNKRMMLNGVTLSDSGKYTIDYNTRQGFLPEYEFITRGQSTAIGQIKCHEDYWGYYNGRSDKCSVPKEAYNYALSEISNIMPEGIYDISNFADRSTDEAFMKYGIIQRITYPTGGHTSFVFEGNGSYLGGLRIKSISNYDGARLLGSKTYTYIQSVPTTDHPLDMMVYKTWHSSDQFPYPGSWLISDADITCSGTPVFPLCTGAGVFYREVCETSDNGDRIYYKYSTDPVPEDLCGHTSKGEQPHMTKPYVNDYGSPKPYLTEKTCMNADGDTLRTEKYSYGNYKVLDYNAGNRLVSFVRHATSVSENLSLKVDYGPMSVNSNTIRFDSVTVHSRVCNLLSKTVTDHATGVTTTETYSYDSGFRTGLPKSVTTVNSDGREHRTEYVYTFDGGSPFYTDMAEKYYMYDVVTGTRKYCDGIPVESRKTDFAVHNGWVYPERTYRSVQSGEYYEKYHFADYGSKGNLLTLITNRCDTSTIAWGYGETYPISHRLNGRLKSAYTWKPLFGVTSVQAENGYTTNYAYDSGGRLSSVSDAHGIMNQYFYNYSRNADGTGGDNYVRTVSRLEAGGSRSIDTWQYGDGLGRPVSEASNGRNTSGSYVYTFHDYDCKGRDSVAWLPAAGGTSVSMPGGGDIAVLAQSTYNDSHAYSKSLYDAIDRPVSQSTPGDEWNSAGRGRTKSYVTNTAGSVCLYQAPLDKTSLVKAGCYPAGTLYGEKTTDEDGHTITVFTDKLGRKVLERRDSGNDTYFVYNDLGQLRYVLSPEYQNAGYKAEYAYEYRYDGRGNVVKKILPGCEYIQYWYDRSDRMTFMQDATLRERGLYRFFLYDRQGRVAVQGTCTECHRGETVNRVSFSASSSGFCGTGYNVPHTGYITNPAIETVSYYDTHDFISLYSDRISGGVSRLTVPSDVCAAGLQTGTFMYAGNGEPLIEAVYYDDRGRVTDTRSVSLGGRCSSTKTAYTYSGAVASSSQTDTSASGGSLLSASLSNGYSYSGGLPVSADLTVGCAGQTGTSRRVHSLTYDSLGRVIKDTRSGNGGSVTYSYNLHGWLTGITGPGFTGNLYYTDGVGTPYYNGNISSMSWTTPDYSRIRGYKFSYDGLNRLTFAEYGEHAKMDTNPNRYDEKVLEYNSNGGIKRFQRRGLKDNGVHGKIDNLSIELEGNRLKKVTDDALPLYRNGASDFADGADADVEYTYNGAGALTSDANRGIANIEYDNMNHPLRVTFTNGNTIKYVYAPDGTKLRTTWLTAVDNIIVPAGSDFELAPSQILYADSTDYVGNAVYHNGKADKYLFDGGYCSFDNNKPVFHYYTKDHLGNNRVVTNEDGTTEQTTHYYPFGGVITDISTNQAIQPYKYNGKELDRMHGWDKYDYGARMYDPILTEWTSVDPLAEKYYHISPYAYCMDNPINSIDPDGSSVWTKILRITAKIGAKVSKNGLKELANVATYADAVSDITDNVSTMFDDKASTTDKISAGVSLASELLPVSVGDVKDAGKIVKAIHGNSKASTKAQHAYIIKEKATGKPVKVGVSGGKTRKTDNKSYRAENQVRKWNKEEGGNIYESEIIHNVPAGEGAREKILEYEKQKANDLIELDLLKHSDKHKRP